MICRGCKAKGTYAAPPSGECPTPYKPDSVLMKESQAREQALQQRLTAADEREDALSSLVPEAELALKALNVAVSVFDVELADSARRGLRLIIAALKP
ncbi:hypothetical protein [Pseudomonas fluorescens]|uniref:hypothetical protein n=1 Tax=Pseudomonas fluorescens TaxID=294 RepID=UPI0012DA0FF7|nr:hypothetical protein [Pseudomonas fluorescens]